MSMRTFFDLVISNDEAFALLQIDQATVSIYSYTLINDQPDVSKSLLNVWLIIKVNSK